MSSSYNFVMGKNPCPKCRENGRDSAGDNFTWYGDGQGGHCFSEDTLVLTDVGSRKISELLGGEVNILNGNHQWETTKFKSYGVKELWELVLTRNGVKKTIKTTSKHRWFVSTKKGEVFTEDLMEGHSLCSNELPQISGLEVIPCAVAHGFVFGDGYKRADRPHCVVPLYTEDKERVLEVIEKSPILVGTYEKVIGGRPTKVLSIRDREGLLKKLPSIEESHSYLYSFLIGYFAADGNLSESTMSIHSKDRENMEFVQAACHKLGIRTHPIFSQKREAGRTYLKDRESVIYGLRFFVTDVPEGFFIRGGHSKPNRRFEYARWKVLSVKNTGVEEEVYCCETSTGSFTLEDYILTGNCFSCSFTIPSEDFLNGVKISKGEALVTEKDLEGLKSKALTEIQIDEIHSETIPRLSVRYRGMNNDVCEDLGVRWKVDEQGSPLAMYYPVHVSESGEKTLVGYKVRVLPKNFHSIGYTGKLSMFLGQTDLVADTLIIVSGEIDLISAISALKEHDKYRKNINIVTSPFGEDSTANMIKLNYDWVDKHKKIIVCMDKDAAGEDAFEKVKEVIDNEKLFKANLRYKDINEYLKQGESQHIPADLYWNAVETKSYGIVGSGNIYDAMLNAATLERVELPPFLSDLNWVFNGGIGLGEIVNLVAPPSVGKTAVINQWILDWLMRSPYKIFVVTLEDSLASYGMKIASKVSGVNIQALPTAEERVSVIEKNRTEIDKYLYNDDMSHRFNILDEIPNSLEDLKTSILQAIKVYGSKIIVIDPLSIILASKTNEEQVDFMSFEEKLKREYNVTIINCLHVRKSGSGKGANSEGAEYSEEDIRGSSAIAGTATINILLNRNKMAEDEIEKNTTTINVSKNRTNGNTGKHLAKIFYSSKHFTLFSYEYAEKNFFFRGIGSDELKKIVDETRATVINNEVNDPDEEYSEALGVF